MFNGIGRFGDLVLMPKGKGRQGLSRATSCLALNLNPIPVLSILELRKDELPKPATQGQDDQ